MSKKIGTILGIFILISALVGGYFLAVEKGFFAKKEIAYNSISDIEQSASLAGEVVNGNQDAVIVETPATEDPKKEVIKKPEPVSAEKPAQSGKVVESEKQIETKSEAGKIVDKLVSWGFAKSSGRKIDTIIVHSSYNSLGGDVFDPDKIIDIYKQYEVSAHYLIGRDGTAYRLVEDKNIAWHAGVSKVPDGRTNVNDFSIGIEMINTMDGKYTEAQYDALNQLIKNLKSKYEIKYILGHNEIAPGRKTDPWGIDWKKVNR